jgi:4-amino-4-deoxy-L-arabinose transferase-like glycosyltransferase
MLKRHKEWWVIPAIFAFATVVMLLFWQLLPADLQANESSDYTNVYEPVARNILAGRGIVDDEGQLATRYPPGFSLLLAAVYGLAQATGLAERVALDVFRLLCSGAAGLLVYGLARLIWSIPLSILAAVVWITYPFGLYLTKQPNSEVPFTPFLLAAVYLLWLALLRRPGAWWLYFLAGALAGAAMVIRPAALGLGMVLSLSAVLFMREQGWGRRLALAALVGAGNLLVILPWEGMVYAQTGEIIPLSSGGTVTIHDGLTFLAVPKEYRQEVAVAEDVEALMWRFQEQRPQMASLGQTAAVVLREASGDPLAFLKLSAIKLSRSWYGIDSRRFETPTILIQLLYLGIIVWGSAAAWRQQRAEESVARQHAAAAAQRAVTGDKPGAGMRRRFIAGSWLVVFYFWAMTITVVPLLRYMLPVMGLLIVFVPGAALSLAQWWSHSERSLPLLRRKPSQAAAARRHG